MIGRSNLWDQVALVGWTLVLLAFIFGRRGGRPDLELVHDYTDPERAPNGRVDVAPDPEGAHA